MTLVNGHGETWTYRKLSTLENKRKRLPNINDTGDSEEIERETHTHTHPHTHTHTHVCVYIHIYIYI